MQNLPLNIIVNIFTLIYFPFSFADLGSSEATTGEQCLKEDEMMPTLPKVAMEAVLDGPSEPVLLSEDFMDSLSYLHDHDLNLYEYLSEVNLQDAIGNVLKTDDIFRQDVSYDHTLSKIPLYLN